MDANSNSMFTCALPLASCQTCIVQVHFKGVKFSPVFFLPIKIYGLFLHPCPGDIQDIKAE